MSVSMTLRLERAKTNRVMWKRFSRCSFCVNKLMAYLEDGHTFDEVVDILKKNHPEIKGIREYTRHAIRSATGLGIWDDYIQEHNLWKLRCPILTKNDKDGDWMRPYLEGVWKERAEKGRQLIEKDKELEPLIQEINSGSETGKLIKYLMERGFPRGSLKEAKSEESEVLTQN